MKNLRQAEALLAQTEQIHARFRPLDFSFLEEGKAEHERRMRHIQAVLSEIDRRFKRLLGHTG